MAEILNRISFDELSTNLSRIFARVTGLREEVVVETGDGYLVALKPLNRVRRRVTKADDSAFLAAAGGWADMDTDSFLRDTYASRRSSRPPVML